MDNLFCMTIRGASFLLACTSTALQLGVLSENSKQEGQQVAIKKRACQSDMVRAQANLDAD